MLDSQRPTYQGAGDTKALSQCQANEVIKLIVRKNNNL